jgi:HPr Serine kinase C-terminal domain
MTLYWGHEQSLKVEGEGQTPAAELAPLLHDLSFVCTQAKVRQPTLFLAARLHDGPAHVPAGARHVLRADGLCGFEHKDDFYLTDGASLLHLQPTQGRAEAQLAPSFGEKPVLLQRQFWAFGVLKLLRPRGFYSLHGAGIVSRHGVGLLLIGASGCGKSTLTLGLVRRGWEYLSDDALLLHQQPAGVEAFALRRHCYVDAAAAAAYADLPLGEEVTDTVGGRRRRVCIRTAFPGQARSKCLPQVLLFPRIVPHAHSILVPAERPRALGLLLAQSGPQLFDHITMPQHLNVLKQLVQQSSCYELQAGLDLYHEPLILVSLLRQAEGEGRWPI